MLPWINSPIYPDEVSMHIYLGRYFQDSGKITGLYQLCLSNYKNINDIFAIPAALFSYMDLKLNLYQFKIFSLFLPFLFALTLNYINYKKNRINNFSFLIGFIGVAGSSLALARNELFQFFNVLICIVSYAYLIEYKKKCIFDYAIVSILIVSGLLSIYSHLQGIIFLPLTFYCIYRVISKYYKNYYLLVIILITFIYLLYVAYFFHHFNCQEYPSVVKFISKMGMQLSDLSKKDFIFIFIEKFNKYFSAFYYLDQYPARYLPGIKIDNQLSQILLNSILKYFIIFNLFLSMSILIYSLYIIYINRYSNESNLSSYITALFVISPALILVVYDPVFNFYRAIFINFILGIGASIFFASTALPLLIRRLLAYYWILLSVVVLLSAIINITLFSPKFIGAEPYEGPSIKSFTNWNQLQYEVIELADKCNVDLSLGRAVVDDLTYSSLKKFPSLYPITYLALQAEIIGISTEDALSRLKPNFILARCQYMEGTKIGIPFTSRLNNLCCYKLTP